MLKITISYFKDELPKDLTVDLMTAFTNEKLLAAVKAAQAVDGYIDVATFRYRDDCTVTENLADAYNALQNGVLTESWTLKPPSRLVPLVKPYIMGGEEYGWRSAMIGDLFIFEGDTYACAGRGFMFVR